MARVSVGRQPIFDQSLNVVGFELFYRASLDASTAADSGDRATAVVVVSTFTELGPQRLVGDHPACLNVTRNFIVGALPLPVPAAGIVLELLPTVGADAEVIDGMQRLRSQGFKLALDDYALNDPRAALIPYADIVKIDIARTPPAQLKVLVEQLRSEPVKLSALRVEGLDDMSRGMELGFDYFQGYHLVRPDVVGATVITPSPQVCAELLHSLAAGLDTVGEVLHTDVALSYRLLRAVDATYTHTDSPTDQPRIRSLDEAAQLLGRERLRAWLQLLTISEADRPTDGQLSAALTRARAMQLLALTQPQASEGLFAEAAYLTGLVASLEQVLGRETNQIVENLPLDAHINAAVLHRSGILGHMLTALEAIENGQDPSLDMPSGRLDAFELNRIHLEAVGWSLQVCQPV